MIEDGRSNGTGAMRVNYPKLMICQKRVPPEIELQAASLADAFENPEGASNVSRLVEEFEMVQIGIAH